MQLSIIIVNYNVKYFLEQCLRSVQAAVGEMDAEIIVIDNHSTDESLAYLQPLFPGIRFMASNRNRGFAKANNRALSVCRGEYVLFLNPDTLVPEDCLHKCIAYINQHPSAGAIGVRMLDGRGRFLPESKRSFPSPIVSLYKLVGLSALFPESPVFNRYALGNLDQHKDHRVEVLAGAFMMVKKELLLQLNGFDEDYFLYGEDIDLSFRMQKAGFENHYFAGTSIIHFKGESSGKQELGRVKFFYRSMLVFVQKHYDTGSGKIFSIFLKMAIAARGAVSAVAKLVKPVALPLADGVLVWLSLQTFRLFWVHGIRSGKAFGVAAIPYTLLFFAALFILSASFTGLYDKRYRASKALLSLGFSMVVVLATYSLLPESIRFSRGVVLWGVMLGAGLILFLRGYLFSKNTGLLVKEDAAAQTVIVGSEKEYTEVIHLLNEAMAPQQVFGRISPNHDPCDSLCMIDDFPALQKNIAVKRIIFCVGELSMRQVITQIQILAGRGLQFLFHTAGSSSIVGSHSLSPGADIVSTFIDYRITRSYQKRMKRVADILLCVCLLPAVAFHKTPMALARNIGKVLGGSCTWVGYAVVTESLPVIKKGIISPLGDGNAFLPGVLEKADRLYAKNYDWWNDIAIVCKNYRRLGGPVLPVKNA